MERKTTKMLAIVAVIGLCAVALIGAAYAAFGGVANTYNEGNSADVGYITLAGSGNTAADVWAPFAADANPNGFSTYVYYTEAGEPAVKTTHNAYYLNNTGDNITIVGNESSTTYINKAVSQKSFVLTKATSENITAVDVSAKLTTAAIGNADFVYIMGVKIGQVEKYSVIGTDPMVFDEMAVSFTNNAATIVVTIYVGYVADGYIESSFPTGAPANAATQTKTQAVHTSDSNAPASFTGATFAFAVADAAA